MKDDAAVAEDEGKLLDIGRLFDRLGRDPKHRREVLALVRAANPDLPIPELDIEAGLDARVTERVKPHEETVAALKGEVSELKKIISRDKWQASHGLSDEELVEVEELAKSDGITKADTAVNYWRQKQALGTPRGTSAAAAMTAEERRELVRNPKQWATKQAARVLQELRGGRIRSA